MTTVHVESSSAAANAAPCAWLPADQITIPRAFSSSESDASFFSTPRGLNEPVFWKSSALRNTFGPSVLEESIGVRWRRPRISSRARSMSSRSTAIARS